jgi:RHS repeat-associated protein
MNIKQLMAAAMLALVQTVSVQPAAAAPNRTFTYDSAGNTLSDGRSYTATYNLRGQLATISKAGVTTTYTYNAAGQRVRKVSSKGPAYTVVFMYDQEGHLLGEYDHTGEALREYVWLHDTPMVVFTPDPANPRGDPLVYFIHTDHLDTPRVIVDRNNVVRWRWISEPFGTTAPETNPSGLGEFTFNLRFPGQYADQESGLFYNYFRYYDRQLGSYTQPDLLGLASGSLSAYGYVDGNPLSYTDPLGLQGTDSPNASLNSAIARGDVRQLENLMEALAPQEQVLARSAIEKFSSRAGDWIGRNCKGSINREFPDQFRSRSLKEILEQAKAGDSAAKKAWKLLNDNRFKK